MTPMANILGCCVVTLLSNNCTLHPFLMADRAKSFIETLFLLLILEISLFCPKCLCISEC